MSARSDQSPRFGQLSHRDGDPPGGRLLRCMEKDKLLKRQPGFKKMVQVSDTDTNQLNILDLQFCNSCDSLIMFESTAFYTCDGRCDFFICLSCAECPSGHALILQFQKPQRGQQVVCSRCSCEIMSAGSKFEVQGNGFYRCNTCEYNVCNQCLNVFSDASR